MPTFRLIAECSRNPRIISNISNILEFYNSDILEMNHYLEPKSQSTFIRYKFKSTRLDFNIKALNEKISRLAIEFPISWKITDTAIKNRVILMVSRTSHCLVDLLDRWSNRELDCEVIGVISNHNNLKSITQYYEVPYYHIPIEKDNKQKGFSTVASILKEHQPETIVLARYMQVIPMELCLEYQNRIINIHHSILPSFIGARPYHQAKNRGVKLIGATGHYVSSILDDGPIIDQDVVRINHEHTVEALIECGKDIEKRVLSRSLRYHLDERVLVHKNKTIVFSI